MNTKDAVNLLLLMIGPFVVMGTVAMQIGWHITAVTCFAIAGAQLFRVWRNGL